MQKNSGFSIIEVMMVVAIIAIMAAIALPSMLGSRSDAKLRGALENLKGDLNRAKMMAVRENALVVVDFGTDRYEVFVDNNAEDWTRGPNERLLANRRLPTGVTVNTDFGGQMGFNRRGLPQNLGTVVLVALDGNQRTIQFNRLGRMNIQ